MANETELSNIVHQTDIVAAIATEAFVTTDSVFPLILTQQFAANTNVIKVPKLGYVTAGTHAESSTYSFGSEDETTDTATTLTGAKMSQAQKITLEEVRFSGAYGTLERHIRDATKALQRLAAAQLKTLFSSTTNQVIATNVLTKDNILDGRYTVTSSVTNATVSPKLIGMFDYKGMNELAKEATSITATAWTNQIDLGFIGIAQGGRPKGELFDVILFETDGLPTTASDDIGQIWDPNSAFVAGVDGNQGYDFRVKEPASQEPWYELFMWAFWHIAQHADTGACKVRSDT